MAEKLSDDRMFAFMAPNDIEKFLNKLGTHRTDIMSRRRQLEEMLPADSLEFRLNAITAQNLDLTLTQLNKIIDQPEGWQDAQGRQRSYTTHSSIQEATSFIEETLEDYLNLPFNIEKAAKANEMMEKARYAVPADRSGGISRGPYLYDRFRALQTDTDRIYSDETGMKLPEADIMTFMDPPGGGPGAVLRETRNIFPPGRGSPFQPLSFEQQYRDFPYPEDDPTREYELNRALLEKAEREPVSDWDKPGSLGGARLYKPQSNLVFEQMRRWDPYADVSEEMRQRSVQKQIELQYGLDPFSGASEQRQSFQRLNRPDKGSDTGNFADGGPVLADPKNYTGIFPPSYGGNPITQSLISPLLSPFLRREEIRPEEIQEVAERELGLNPQTGMPEFTSTVEVVPGEYGPIEGGGGITGLLTSGVLNFLKAKNFLSTPEGREQAATIAQELPGQLTQAGQDYVSQQMDMADRGLQEAYDPETGEMVDFNVPLTVAEAMIGTGVAQPAVQLQRGEFISPMVQKVKGGTQLNVRSNYLLDYKKEMEKVPKLNTSFSSEDREGILKKIEKYFTNEAGTPNDPIRAMLLRGDLTSELGRETASFESIDPFEDYPYYMRGTPALTPSLPGEIRREADRADQIIALQNQLRTLDETRGPADMGLPHEGYRNVEDLTQVRSLQNQITQLAEQDTGLTQQTMARQLFDKQYDDALPISGTLLTNVPERDLDVYERKDVKYEKVKGIKENIKDELTQRQAQYEQMSRKFDPNIPKVFLTQPFQGFNNQAELERYRDLALGPRFPQEIAPFVGIDADIYASTPNYLIDRVGTLDDEEAVRQLFENDQSIRRAMDNDEILYSPTVRRTETGGLGFMEPGTFMENVSLLDPKKIKNMSFPQMVKAGREAQLKNITELTTGDKPAELAAAVRKNPNIRKQIKPQVLLQSKGLETMMTGDNGIIFRLLRPEDTALEGAVMEHSVGRYNNPLVYPDYNENRYLGVKGGRQGFLEGVKRVYSLRDSATGRPRITIDLSFDTSTNRPLEVHQIKGFDNDDKISPEDQDLLFSFLKNVGVGYETVVRENNAIGQAVSSLFARPYAEGGIVSLANGGPVEHGIVTL